MGTPGLTLYTTDHCTLCEQALDLLLSMPELAGLALSVRDVAADAVLTDRYGERLPVLAWDAPGARELDWPFTAGDVTAWLRALQAQAR